MDDLDLELQRQLLLLKEGYARNPNLATIVGLDVILGYLDAAGFDGDLLVPFVKLRGALTDAATGIHNPLIAVSPIKRGDGGSNKPIEKSFEWATAAAAMSFLIRSGMSRNEAAKYAADRAKLVADDPNHTAADKLLHFRTRLDRGEGKVRKEAKQLYEWTKSEWSKANLTDREKADGILKTLRGRMV